MKLTYFAGNPPNFGDELNATMWDHILPADFLNDDDSDLFLGIGSIIQHNYPATSRKVVVGSGYAGYTKMPDVKDGSWDIRFVRGPQTAEVLGLDPRFAISDAAIMLRALPLPKAKSGLGVAFIPHYESIQRGAWKEVCALAGVHFIDPTQPTDQVISEIKGASLVICEAMHGAIVSDALRTPWIGVKTMQHVHRFKWYDWARSLDIDYRPQRLMPSNCREAWAYSTGRGGDGPGTMKYLAGAHAAPANLALKHIAARSMIKLAKCEPQLSSDQAIERATDRALSAVDLMVREYTAKRQTA